jgi:hypothetical protein
MNVVACLRDGFDEFIEGDKLRASLRKSTLLSFQPNISEMNCQQIAI